MRTKISVKQDFIKIPKQEKEIKKPKLSKKEKKCRKRLLKVMKKDPATNNAEDFSHTKLANVVLNEDSIYHEFKGTLRKRKTGATKPTSVLINSAHNMFYRLSIDTYKRLSKIQYMTISMSVEVLVDGHDDDDEPEMFMSKEYNIASMNELFNYVYKRDGICESLNIYIGGDGWYSTISMIEDCHILYKDGTVARMTFDKFLRKYDMVSNRRGV